MRNHALQYVAMFTPSEDILSKYADLLVKFALQGGQGAKPKEVVQCMIPDVAKPIYKHLLRAILESGAYPKLHLIATETDRMFFDYANDDQLTYFPEAYKRAEADLIDHQVSIIADANPRELQDIDPKKMFMAMDARRKLREWLFEKENHGKFSWTLCLYGTEAMAKEAGLSLEEYWQQIIEACYLDCPDPIAEWTKIQAEIERLKNALTALRIESVHVEAEHIDLHVRIGERRQWLGGSGRNIPSFEVFVSPDWRGTEGTIAFDQPLYRFGNVLRGIKATFKNGECVNISAEQGEEILKSMISRENANRIGEFSLTDSRLSRVTKFMANTLYDENVGGRYGNTHIAFGNAYKESIVGDLAAMTPEEFEALGMNKSPEHTDIISTEDRTVTAKTFDGSSVVIFKDGKFTV